MSNSAFQIRIPAEDNKKIEALAESENRSKNNYIQKVLHNHVNHKNVQKKLNSLVQTT